MINFIMSNMETVKRRIKKPAITAIIIMVMLLIQETFIRHTIGHFLTKELFSSIGFCYMMGGLWYGKSLLLMLGRRPEDEYGEYYPEYFQLTIFRMALAATVGATVGAVCFGIDTLRIIMDKIKTVAEAKKA